MNDTIGPDLFLTLGLDATTGTDILSTDTLDGTALGTVFNNVTINASGAITPAGSVTWDLKKYNRQVKAASVDWDMQVWDVNYTASGSSKRNISNFFKFNPIITLGTTSPSSVPLGGGPWKVTFEWEVR